MNKGGELCDVVDADGTVCGQPTVATVTIEMQSITGGTAMTTPDRLCREHAQSTASSVHRATISYDREWRRIPTTNDWGLADEGTQTYLRHIAVRDPYMNEPCGTKYSVTGNGHAGQQIFDSLEAAQRAAERTLE